MILERYRTKDEALQRARKLSHDRPDLWIYVIRSARGLEAETQGEWCVTDDGMVRAWEELVFTFEGD